MVAKVNGIVWDLDRPFEEDSSLELLKFDDPDGMFIYTVMFLSFWTDRSGQTVQTQIRLLLEEQSDQGLHCLPFRLYRLDSLLCGRAT